MFFQNIIKEGVFILFKILKNLLGFVLISALLIPSALAATESVPIKPTFTAIAFASGNTITIKITSGSDINHAAIINSDQSTWIGNMSGNDSSWTYTVTDLTPETTYTFWVKACSIDNGAYGPPENVTWQSVTATTQKIKTVYSLSNSGMMCLTFDDGYGESAIKTVLDCLHENGVHATFFIIGKCLKAYPELWQQAIADGNEICYHSMKHEQLTSYTDQQIIDDINKWNQTATEILGENYIIPKLARLPGGAGNNSQRVLKVFYNLGYTVIAWNSDTYTGVIKDSTSNTTQKCANYVINMSAAGTISLQHFNSYDANSVPLYIKTLLNNTNFTLGTISEAIIANQNKT